MNDAINLFRLVFWTTPLWTVNPVVWFAISILVCRTSIYFSFEPVPISIRRTLVSAILSGWSLVVAVAVEGMFCVLAQNDISILPEVSAAFVIYGAQTKSPDALPVAKGMLIRISMFSVVTLLGLMYARQIAPGIYTNLFLIFSFAASVLSSCSTSSKRA